jgi:PAS domain S-box-containing protein
VLLITPLILTAPNLLRIRSGARIGEFAELLLLLTATCFIVFGDLPLIPVKLHVLAFAVLPFVMWAAIRFGVSGAAVSIVFVATIASVETALGSGPFALHTPFTNAVLLDVFFAVLSVSGMTLAAVIAQREQSEREREQLIRKQAGIEARLRLATIDITERKQAEEALRESEDKLRMLLDSTAEAIYGIDVQGRCTFCNQACLRALGYGRIDELLGKNMHDLIHHTRADGTLFPVEECQIFRAFRTGEGVHVDNEVLWRANGTSFPAEYWSHPQRKGRQIVGAVVAFIDITEHKLAEEALSNVNRRLIEAQEQERTRIARELHDDIGQRLALLAIKLEQLHLNSPDLLPEVRSHTGELWKLTTDIATDIQSLSHELHSSKLQHLGIAAAIRGFCKEFGAQQNVEINFQTHDLPSPLSPETSLCFFRVLQEALHNSAKHSGVQHFEVRLWGAPGEIHLTVSDSGSGFDSDVTKPARGLGLISMEERLKALNGTFSIESQPKRGTTIHARVPFRSDSEPMRKAG